MPTQSNKTHIAKMSCQSSFYLHETSAEEIMHIIDTLTEKKGTRQNDIPVKILKLCSEILSSFLAKILQLHKPRYISTELQVCPSYSYT